MDLAIQPTDVYTAYDIEGRHLYVGISRDAFGRLRQHRQSSAWWDLATHFSVDRYHDRWTAAKEEAFSIAIDAPPFNVALDRAALDERWREVDRGIQSAPIESHEFAKERLGLFRVA